MWNGPLSMVGGPLLSRGVGERTDAEVAELDPAGVAFGAVGLQGEDALLAVAGVAVGGGVRDVDDLVAVEVDDEVGADGEDAELVPVERLAVGVGLVALREPGGRAGGGAGRVGDDDAAGVFAGGGAADVDLVAVLAPAARRVGRRVAEVDAGVVLAVLVDHELELELEVLELL